MENVNFRFANCNSTYGLEGGVIGHRDIERVACFSYAFRNLDEEGGKQKYHIILYTDPMIVRNKSIENYFFMETSIIDRYLKAIKLTVPGIKWKVEGDIKHDGYKAIGLHLEIDGPRLIHKYVLTVVRYLWEFPRSVCLYDAYQLKSLKEFRFESIMNLFNLCMGCYPGYKGMNHGTNSNAIRYNNKDLKERIEWCIKNSISVNDIYPSNHRTEFKTLYVEKDDNYKNTSYWVNKEEFEKRLIHYKTEYERVWIKKSMW